jgi:hypothetical protein
LIPGGADRASGAPPVPEDLAATGLGRSLLNGLILRQLYVFGPQATATLARQLGLASVVIVPLLQALRVAALLEVSPRIEAQNEPIGGLTGRSGWNWALSASGRRHAAESLERFRYVGRAPVPLEQYRRWVLRDSAEGSLGPLPQLRQALADTVLMPEQIRCIGQALGGRGMLYLHGPAGSGKTHLLASLQRALEGAVWVPHAIAVGDLIIEVFDPQWHQPLAESALPSGHVDARWSLCRRPVIRAGAAFSPAMLTLRREAGIARLHAPLQIKAAGGWLMIDDFGRQPAIARALISRWLGPVERGRDWLSVPGGLSFEVPFACRLVLAASVPPQSLGDAAFCRRLACRIELREPDQIRFREIVSRLCRSRGRGDAQRIAHWLTDRLQAEARPRWPGTAASLVDAIIEQTRDDHWPPSIDANRLDAAWDRHRELAIGS